MKRILHRHEKNPILKPVGYDWEAVAVFNPAVMLLDGKIHVFYRAIGEYQNYISRLGHAVFDEELNLIERDEKPFFEPDFKTWWEKSIEDARITVLEETIYMTYVVTITPFPPGGVRIRLGIPKSDLVITRIGLAKISRDLKRIKRLGVISPLNMDERDTVLFPERINGKLAVLHRPSKWIGQRYGTDRPGIWFAYLDENSYFLYSHKLVMKPEYPWESYKIGSGAPPLKTEKGWLLIYHGVDNNRVYRAGAALLDLEEPWKVLARTRKPILEPEEEYEKIGDMPNVVFPEGAVILGEELLIFYGAADKVCCVARANIDELLDGMLSGKL